MRDIWTEKYRPKNIDEYVFRDEKQEKQIKRWIKEKSIPHLLLSGNAGIGKCLRGTETIDIKIDTSTLTSKQIAELEKYKT